MSGHPPFGAQVILNGHDYVACQARRAGVSAFRRRITASPMSLTPPNWPNWQTPYVPKTL